MDYIKDIGHKMIGGPGQKERDEKAKAFGFCSHNCRVKNGLCTECDGFGNVEPFAGLESMDPKYLPRVVGIFTQERPEGRIGESVLKVEEDAQNNALRVLRKSPLTDSWAKVGYLIQTLPNEDLVAPREKLNQVRSQLSDRCNDVQQLRTILHQKESEVETMRRIIHKQNVEISRLGHNLQNERSTSYGRIEEAKSQLARYHAEEREKLKKQNEELNHKILEMGYEMESISDENYQRDYENVKNGLTSSVPNFCHTWQKSTSGEIHCERGDCVYNPDLFSNDKHFERQDEVDFYVQCEAKVFDVILREVSKHFIVGFEEILLKAMPYPEQLNAGSLDQNMRYMSSLFNSLSKPDRLPPPFTENDRTAFNTWRASLFRTFQAVHQAKTTRKNRDKEPPASNSINAIVAEILEQLGDLVCFGSSKSKDTPPSSLIKCIKAVIGLTTRLGASKAEFFFGGDMVGYPFDPDAMVSVSALKAKQQDAASVKRVLFPALMKRGDDSGGSYDKVMILTKASVVVKIDQKKAQALNSTEMEATIRTPFEQPSMAMGDSDNMYPEMPVPESSGVENASKIEQEYEFLSLEDEETEGRKQPRDSKNPDGKDIAEQTIRQGSESREHKDEGEEPSKETPKFDIEQLSSTKRLPRNPTKTYGVNL